VGGGFGVGFGWGLSWFGLGLLGWGGVDSRAQEGDGCQFEEGEEEADTDDGGSGAAGGAMCEAHGFSRFVVMGLMLWWETWPISWELGRWGMR